MLNYLRHCSKWMLTMLAVSKAGTFALKPVNGQLDILPVWFPYLLTWKLPSSTPISPIFVKLLKSSGGLPGRLSQRKWKKLQNFLLCMFLSEVWPLHLPTQSSRAVSQPEHPISQKPTYSCLVCLLFSHQNVNRIKTVLLGVVLPRLPCHEVFVAVALLHK